jgi:hypothetical protein
MKQYFSICRRHFGLTTIFICSIIENMNIAYAKVKDKSLPTRQLLKQVLLEIRILRHEFSLLLPSEDIEEYEHPDRIKRSYQKAIKKYPPAV